MSGNTSLNFEINELMSINSTVADSRASLEANYSKIKGCFDELRANVTGTQINGLLSTITDNLTTINTKMETSFDQLTEFLNSQMKNYTTTYENALGALNSALSFINNNL